MRCVRLAALRTSDCVDCDRRCSLRPLRCAPPRPMDWDSREFSRSTVFVLARDFAVLSLSLSLSVQCLYHKRVSLSRPHCSNACHVLIGMAPSELASPHRALNWTLAYDAPYRFLLQSTPHSCCVMSVVSFLFFSFFFNRTLNRQSLRDISRQVERRRRVARSRAALRGAV